MAIPQFINMALSYTTIWTGWVFYYDESCRFTRGPLAFIPYAVSSFYMILMIIWSVQDARKNGTRELIVVFSIVVAGMTTAVLEGMFRFHYLLNTVIAIALVFYYLFMYSQIFKRDALTNLFNRRIFYLDLNDFAQTAFILVSIDINNLKKMNDEYGHDAGDRLIKTVVGALRKSLRYGCTFYRTGGDEFMIIYRKGTESQVAGMIAQARGYLNGTGYSFAAGQAQYQPGMNIETVCLSADSLMYEEKRRSKQCRL